jgi:hypothetical protein
MKGFLGVVGLGCGLALGGSVTYALFVSESARLLGMFLLGAVLFGSTVMLTALAINRQWAKLIGEQRTTHNHRYQIQHSPPPVWDPNPAQRQPDLLPPLSDKSVVWDSVNLSEREDDEVVA